MSILNKIKSRICKVEWCVAIREKRSFFFEDISTPFIPIPNTFRYWAADPFLVDFDDKTMLFVELYDRFKRKGLLGYMDVTNGINRKFKTVFETRCHLSYPMCFTKDGILYAIPESNNIKELILLRWDKRKEKFIEDKAFMSGYCLADANFIETNDGCYMLATEVTSYDNVGTLSLFKYSGGGSFIASPDNPIIQDKSLARNGGMIIKHDENLYRVSQDCGRGYGSGINLMRIDKISLGAYQETLIKKVLPSDITIEGVKKVDGIHTYNSNDKYEVIDYKIDHKFSLAEILGFVLCKLKIVTKIEK